MSPPTYFARTVASFAISAVFLTAAMPTLAHADEPTANGKLLLTGGVSQVEGSAGGGLAPWGVIGGYGTGDKIDGSVHGTYIHTQDFSIGTYGVAIGVADRVELTMARQTFDTRDAGLQLGLGRGFKFNQDILGVKARVFGDAVLDEDTWMPQVSVGVQLKHDEQGSVVESLGAHSDSGADFYASATKLLLAQRVLLNATVRSDQGEPVWPAGFWRR